MRFLLPGTAENNLGAPAVCSAFASALGEALQPRSLKYDAFEGAPEFLSAAAAAMETWLGVPVDATQLAACCGAGTALSNLALVLGDTGDGVIIPTPCYGALPMDVGVLAGLEMIPAPLSSSDNFCLSALAIEKAYITAKALGKTVRALLLTSPDNPTGRIHSADALVEVFTWARSVNIHLIVDEIYAESAHSGEFISMARALESAGLWKDEFAMNKLHVVYGFAKDFSASGLRTGLVFTRNARCRQALVSISPFSSISRPTQIALTTMLTNTTWLSTYRRQNRESLKAALGRATDHLCALKVPFIPASAGLFVCLDLRSFLKESSREGEMRLFQHIFSHKLFLTPGMMFFFSEVRHEP